MARLVPEALIARLCVSPEPAARWLALTALAGRSPEAPDVVAAHDAALADPRTADLLARLTPWEAPGPLSGHDKPEFLPNLLGLLADMGVTADDDPHIAVALESMLAHQADDGRFLATAQHRANPTGVWAALPCDSHAILETLARAGRTDDPRVLRAFDHLAATIEPTDHGPAWKCIPDPQVAFRGPGRRPDPCPQVTLEALRAFSWLAPERRPPALADAVRTSLAVWRRRGESKPYMFGHGRSFKQGKWPATWYSALAVVDAVGRYPGMWSGPTAAAEDRRAMAELAACLRAYTLDEAGNAVPHSNYRGWEAHSFGQKKVPSHFAAARIAVALARVEAIAGDVFAVDVTTLGSSKGGSGVPLPPTQAP